MTVHDELERFAAEMDCATRYDLLLTMLRNEATIAHLEKERDQLREVLQRAEWALGIAKYRLDGSMNYPEEPNSITESLTELRALLPVTDAA